MLWWCPIVVNKPTQGMFIIMAIGGCLQCQAASSFITPCIWVLRAIVYIFLSIEAVNLKGREPVF